MQSTLYRSQTNKMLAGVCGGLGQYLNIDPTFVRLFFVLFALGSGVGVFVYILLWIVIPYESAGGTATLPKNVDEFAERARAMGDDVRSAAQTPSPRAGTIIGVSLILLGAMFLVQNLDIPWLRWLDFNVLWPVMLIVGGVALIWRRFRK